MNNINELRRELASLFDRIKDGSIDAPRAKEMNNAAGKILKSVKTEMEYAELRKEVPDIPYMRGR